MRKRNSLHRNKVFISHWNLVSIQLKPVKMCMVNPRATTNKMAKKYLVKILNTLKCLIRKSNAKESKKEWRNKKLGDISMNGLNNLVKRQRSSNGKNKQDLPLCYLLQSHFRFKDTD